MASEELSPFTERLIVVETKVADHLTTCKLHQSTTATRFMTVESTFKTFNDDEFKPLKEKVDTMFGRMAAYGFAIVITGSTLSQWLMSLLK